MSKKTQWIPEIYYEDAPDGITSNIPFIDVPEGHEMPPLLFIFESRQTGQFEPSQSGEESPIVELDLFRYANLKLLEKNLTTEQYDVVRLALGLERSKDAEEKGKKLKIFSSANQEEI